MLNFVLSMLMGPSNLEIQVKNPDKYFFKPVSLLKKVVFIMGNMSQIEKFITFVVNDGRFSFESQKKALYQLKKN